MNAFPPFPEFTYPSIGAVRKDKYTYFEIRNTALFHRIAMKLRRRVTNCPPCMGFLRINPRNSIRSIGPSA